MKRNANKISPTYFYTITKMLRLIRKTKKWFTKIGKILRIKNKCFHQIQKLMKKQ